MLGSCEIGDDGDRCWVLLLQSLHDLPDRDELGAVDDIQCGGAQLQPRRDQRCKPIMMTKP